MKLPIEIEDLIVDLFCNSKMSVEYIISLIDQKNLTREFTIEDFYCLLYERQCKEGKRLNRTVKDYESSFDNQLYQWRKDGKSVNDIMFMLEEKGIIIKEDDLIDRILKNFKHRGDIDSRIIKWHDGKIEITEDELDIIKSKCKTYREIEQYYKDKDIIIPYSTIKSSFKDCINRVETNIKKYKCMGRQPCKLEGKDEEVFDLRENKMSYELITKHFEDNGLEVSHETVRKKCKEIYEKKGLKEPKNYRFNPNRDTENRIAETVYNLRKYEKYSYQDILDYFLDKGIRVEYSQILRICKNMFKEKNERIPKSKRKIAREINNRELSYHMKKKKTCREITEFFNNKGVNVSYSYIVEACRKIKNNQNKYKRRTLNKVKDKNLIIDVMLKIGEKRKATQEQMKKFAEEVSKYYGEDIRFDFDENMPKTKIIKDEEER